MSMILFACVVRVRDGLPLSASSDFHLDPRFLECRKRLKVLSSILTQYPERGTAKERDLSIHFHTSGGIACTCIAISSYPAVMAFCFLEELRCKFATSYNATNSVVQKTQNQFNHTNCAQPKIDVAKMQEDLRLRPPALVSWEDMELMNGIVNGRAEAHLETGELSYIGMRFFLSCLPDAASLSFGDPPPCPQHHGDHQGIGNIIAFLLPFMSCFGLCYLYLFYTSARKIKVFILLATVCLCNVYLYGLRNNWQILFHIAVASFSSHQILTRQVAEKQPDLGV
ncbi:hypothetical protein Chor_014577 [Crotalus horridus]